MNDVLFWDSTFYERSDYAYVTFWFKTLNARLLAMPGFKFAELSIFLRRYASKSFRQLVAEIISHDPLSKELTTETMDIKVLKATMTYEKFILTNKKGVNAILIVPPTLKIGRFLQALHTTPQRMQPPRFHISTDAFFAYVCFRGPKTQDDALKSKVLEGV